jgi:hypothetical protein
MNSHQLHPKALAKNWALKTLKIVNAVAQFWRFPNDSRRSTTQDKRIGIYGAHGCRVRNYLGVAANLSQNPPNPVRPLPAIIHNINLD